MGNTALTCEFGMSGQMHGFAMCGNGDLRANPVVHARHFGTARMPGHMNQAIAIGDDFNSLPGEAVDDGIDCLFVAGNRARRKDDTVAGRKARTRMLVFGNACKSCTTFALTAGSQDDNLVARQVAKRIDRQKLRHVVKITELARDGIDTLHGTARKHNLDGLRPWRPAPQPATRATLEANVVTSTLCGASAISFSSDAATSLSEGLSPSRSMLVESQTSASTPSSPNWRKRASSVSSPPGSHQFSSPRMQYGACRRTYCQCGTLRESNAPH